MFGRLFKNMLFGPKTPSISCARRNVRLACIKSVSFIAINFVFLLEVWNSSSFSPDRLSCREISAIGSYANEKT